jgi:ABC-type multidrug transport system fused ATPase/permease subunit
MTNKIAVSDMRRLANIFSQSDKKKLIFATILQIFLNSLDLIGVLSIGLLATLTIQNENPNIDNTYSRIISQIPGIQNLAINQQIFALGMIASISLISRTLFSAIYTRRILFFFSYRGAQISSNLVSKLLSEPLLKIQSRTSQESLYSVTRGVELLTMQVLAPFVVLVSDLSLLILIGGGLLFADPLMGLISILALLILSLVMYRNMAIRVNSLGVEITEISVSSNRKIIEALSSFKELSVRNRIDFFTAEVSQLRNQLSDKLARISFYPYVSKYLIESLIVLGSLSIGAAQFILYDMNKAVTTLAIFLTAGTRVAPAILRIQQGAIQIRGSLGQATSALDLIETLGSGPGGSSPVAPLDTDHYGFTAAVQLKDLTFSYPNASSPAMVGANLEISHGQTIAIVGPSGAGKSTLVDLMLGFLTPREGRVIISGLSPNEAINEWPGAIGYVPQDISFSSGTIRENVKFGFPYIKGEEDLVSSALKIAQLDSFVLSLPDGIDTRIGENGLNLSGGQRQRLGIARAMFTKPRLLIMDEATSSLDGETEASISLALDSLKGKITTIIIAHRLSTARFADIVVYIEAGRILSIGTFDEVRSSIANFDNQAKLMGL